MSLQPPPIQDLKEFPFSFQMWFNQIRNFVSGTAGSIAWSAVSKAGANITDIPNRDHNNLLNIFGGAAADYYHWKQTEYTSFTDVITLTSTGSITTTNGYILADSTSGAITLTLPAASTKKRFHIKRKNAGANNVTIQRAGADTIEGSTTLTLAAQYKSYTIWSDGSATWYIEAST
jgi:hypothetical protein